MMLTSIPLPLPFPNLPSAFLSLPTRPRPPFRPKRRRCQPSKLPKRALRKNRNLCSPPKLWHRALKRRSNLHLFRPSPKSPSQRPRRRPSFRRPPLSPRLPNRVPRRCQNLRFSHLSPKLPNRFLILRKSLRLKLCRSHLPPKVPYQLTIKRPNVRLARQPPSFAFLSLPTKPRRLPSPHLMRERSLVLLWIFPQSRFLSRLCHLNARWRK